MRRIALFNKAVLVLCLSVLVGCSSTANKDYQVLEREYSKKPLVSDLHLKVALLNRPVPQDQQMMLAFAKQRELITEQYPELAYVPGVSIRGSKEQDNKAQYVNAGYQGLKVNEFVATDVNAISLVGPK